MTMGCPQGSCSGPLFWSIILNDLLNDNSLKDNKITAFADDIMVVCSAGSRLRVEEKCNRTLEKIVNWGKRNKLKFNPDKTNAIAFTKCQIERRQPTIKMNGKVIRCTTQIKYLGITIDNKLLWTPQIEQIKNKVGNLFQEIAKVAKREWGRSGKALIQIYKGVIIPIVTYGAQVWGKRVNLIHTKRKIISLQRKILLRITGAYSTTSNDALCVMAGLLPLDLEVNKRRDTRNIIKQNINSHDILRNGDIIEQKLKVHQHLKRFEWKHIKITQYNESHPHRVYTDGSRSSTGVGAAFIYFTRTREQYHKKFKLDNRCNNYQAELVAIHQAIKWINTNKKNLQILVCTDSESILKALNDPNNTHELINSIRQNIIIGINKIQLSWVKAHMGNIGNEKADNLANEASDLTLKEIYSKLSEQYIKREIKNKYLIIWQRRWEESRTGRELFEYLPDINQRVTNSYFIIHHKNTRFLTGHGDFADYHRRFNHGSDGLCENCGTEETPTHILMDCIRYELPRHNLMLICNKEGYQWPVRKRILINNEHIYYHFNEFIKISYKNRI
ncbi:uncharacterized protein [Centruroides vittatus]|uniref:uncharacterized protein n=1 Tax=Centruroides vittatus TaxID=120091 RepID=UPI00350F4A7A